LWSLGQHRPSGKIAVTGEWRTPSQLAVQCPCPTWAVMATRERPADRGRRRARDNQNRLAADIRYARLGAGLSLRDVAAAARLDHGQLWRFERRRCELTPVDLSAVCEAVGLELAMRAYPGGDPIRDAGHARLLARLRGRLAPGLRWRTEVPLPGPQEMRAWDAVITGSDWRLPVEAETVVFDVQALERRLALKRRDGGAEHILLLLADTPRNRRALLVAPAAFPDLPLRNRAVLGRLATGRPPDNGGMVFL